MTAPRRPRPVPVPGSAAWVIVTFLKRRNEFQAWLLGVAPNLKPQEWHELQETLAELQILAAEQLAYRGSEVGTSEPSATQPAEDLPHEVDVRKAADMLGVSEEMVRRHCREGRLEARQVGRQWRIERTSVEMLQQGRAA